MTRRKLTGLTGIVVAVTLLLSGCASVPKDDQLEAWNAAVLAGVPNAVGAQAHASSKGFITEIVMDVTIHNDVHLTYDDLRATYAAIIGSTTEEWRGENMGVQFVYADSPDRALMPYLLFDDAGVDARCHENTTREWPEWSVCAGFNKPRMILSLDAARGKGFPPATQTPTDAGPRVPEITAEQLAAWTDAIQGSDPDVVSVEIKEMGRIDDEDHYLMVRVLLPVDTILMKYSTMKNVYEAMMTATDETWRGERARLYFDPADFAWSLSSKEAFDAAGITDQNTATVTTDGSALEIILDPTELDFPGVSTDGSA
jgi:hypothetical protein